MIILNGKKFAENNKEYISSLFSSPSCVGMVKVNKRSINLLDSQGLKIGVITRHCVLARAKKVDTGWWYSYGPIPIVGEYDDSKDQRYEVSEIVSRFGLNI